MSIMPIFHTRRRTSHDLFSGDTYPLNEYRHESAIAATHPYPHSQPHVNEYCHESAIAATHPHPQPRVLSPPPTNHRHHLHHHDANGFMANSRVEWREGPDAYFIRIELPGIRREDVKVTIQEDEKLLKITGFRNMEYKDTHDNWHHVERSGGKFMTAFVLPEDAVTVRPDQIKVTMENGVLNVTLPKRMPKYHVTPIEIVV